MNKNKKAKLPLHVIPEKWAVLYVPPMKDEFEHEGRKCSNCFMWASLETKCIIHPEDIDVPGNAVCGYHVPGDPLEYLGDYPNVDSIQKLDPEFTGLENHIPEEGTMCGNCHHFIKGENEMGHCSVVAKSNDKLPIHAIEVSKYSCCARWEGK